MKDNFVEKNSEKFLDDGMGLSRRQNKIGLLVSGQPASHLNPDVPSDYVYRHQSSKMLSPFSNANSRFSERAKFQGLNNNSSQKQTSDPFEAKVVSPSQS